MWYLELWIVLLDIMDWAFQLVNRKGLSTKHIRVSLNVQNERDWALLASVWKEDLFPFAVWVGLKLYSNGKYGMLLIYVYIYLELRTFAFTLSTSTFTLSYLGLLFPTSLNSTTLYSLHSLKHVAMDCFWCTFLRHIAVFAPFLLFFTFEPYYKYHYLSPIPLPLFVTPYDLYSTSTISTSYIPKESYQYFSVSDQK